MFKRPNVLCCCGSLGERLRDDASADGAAALTDGELEALLQRDGRDELEVRADVVAGHAHAHTLRQRDGPRDVRRPAPQCMLTHSLIHIAHVSNMHMVKA